MTTDPTLQIHTLRAVADIYQACADFLDAAAQLIDEFDAAESARLALQARVYEEGARLRTVRLLEVVQAHPEVEAMP